MWTRGARVLLTLLLPKHDRDTVLGDLDEECRLIARDAGPRTAALWYWRQVLASVPAVVGSLWLAGFLRFLLFGVEPNDIPTLAFAIVFLCAVALCACLVPVLRASRVDPAITLRQE